MDRADETREAYEACAPAQRAMYAGGDAEAVRALLAEGIVWHVRRHLGAAVRRVSPRVPPNSARQLGLRKPQEGASARPYARVDPNLPLPRSL